MTSPLRRKHPTTRPSIPRSTRINIYCSIVAGLLFAPGCGITPDGIPVAANNGAAPARHAMIPQRHESSQYSLYRTRQPRRTSRFADIEQVTFFEESKPIASPPVTPPPAPAPAVRKPVSIRPAESKPVPALKELAPAVVVIPATDTIEALPSCGPVKSAIQQTQARGYDKESPIPDPVDDPRKLKKITEILPYAYYEPDPLVRAKDPCKNLCPRPDGAPCDKGKVEPCPDEVVLSNEDYIPRNFAESVYGWEASNVHYNPLYFEDFALERYGHTYPCWVQPFASVGKFSLQFVGLPYQMGIDPICKKMYPLGYYRPGECAPKLLYQIPWNTRAALSQVGVTTGLIFLIP